LWQILENYEGGGRRIGRQYSDKGFNFRSDATTAASSSMNLTEPPSILDLDPDSVLDESRVMLDGYGEIPVLPGTPGELKNEDIAIKQSLES